MRNKTSIQYRSMLRVGTSRNIVMIRHTHAFTICKYTRARGGAGWYLTRTRRIEYYSVGILKIISETTMLRRGGGGGGWRGRGRSNLKLLSTCIIHEQTDNAAPEPGEVFVRARTRIRLGCRPPARAGYCSRRTSLRRTISRPDPRLCSTAGAIKYGNVSNIALKINFCIIQWWTLFNTDG